jgi:hypothetical protein
MSSKLTLLDQSRGKNRLIGEVDIATKTFKTHRDWDKHFFINFRGFGFNQGLIKRLRAEGILEIWMFLTFGDKTELWKTTPQIVLDSGQEWFNLKDAKDIQLILPIEYFKKN